MGQQIQPKRPLTWPGVGLKDIKGMTKVESHMRTSHMAYMPGLNLHIRKA